MGGANEGEAENISNRSMDDMRKVSKYPEDMPSNKDPEEIMQILEELDNIFENEEED